MTAAISLFAAGYAQGQQLFDFTSDPLTGPPVPVNYTPAPFLKDNGAGTNNAAAVSGFLAGQPVKAVKVDNLQTLTPATIATVFGPNNVKYTFFDYEGPGATARFAASAAVIRNTGLTGAAIQANQSYIGNFDLAPIAADPSRAPGYVPPSYSDYIASGANMANEALYPGSGSFKMPSEVGGTSTAPNIRSALFTLPITRASIVTAGRPAGHQHIPYVTRFNNVVGGLQNGTALNPLTGQVQPAFHFDAAHGTAGQLLSRGDFKALIAHYRARGAHGVHALDGGVIGYTQQQFNDDVAEGWNFAPFASVLNGPGGRIATLDTAIRVDGQTKSIEDAGTVASGVYSLTQNGGLGKLALLISNLDDETHSVTFPAKIGGKTVAGSFQVLAGQHKLLEFTGAGTQWSLVNPGGTAIFADDNRDGVGVPEPTMIGGLGLVLCLGLSRRRRA